MCLGLTWWREIAKICDGVGGCWFEKSVLKKVGNGLHSYFWYDPWLGGTPLCVRFKSLLDLAENKLTMVTTMVSLGVGCRGLGIRGCGRGRRSC